MYTVGLEVFLRFKRVHVLGVESLAPVELRQHLFDVAHSLECDAGSRGLRALFVARSSKDAGGARDVQRWA